MASNNTTDHYTFQPPKNHFVYYLYIFAFFTVGSSSHKLLNLYLTHRKGAKNIFLILPSITLITTLLIMLLDYYRIFRADSTNDDLLLGIYITQYILDWPSAICLALAFWNRLNLLIQAESTMGAFPILRHAIKLLLIHPITWGVVDIIGIIDLFTHEYSEVSLKVEGIYNMWGGLNNLTSSIIFIVLITRIPSIKNNPKYQRKILMVAPFIACNSLLLARGIIFLSEQETGLVIIYSSWLVDVFWFMVLNDIVASLLKKRTKTITVSTVKMNEEILRQT